MRTAARVDANQSEIVAILRQMGATVQPIHMVGRGCPDIIVGYRGQNFLFEIKDGSKPPSKRQLTRPEAAWHENWRGTVHVITCAAAAVSVLNDFVDSG